MLSIAGGIIISIIALLLIAALWPVIVAVLWVSVVAAIVIIVGMCFYNEPIGSLVFLAIGAFITYAPPALRKSISLIGSGPYRFTKGGDRGNPYP